MTTYNTYQEAKIANPECEIFHVSGIFFFNYEALASDICNPADYCMTYNQCDEFKAGMVIMDLSGIKEINEDEAAFLNEVKGYHTNKSNWDECFILRAAALENIPTETTEEKEVLDGIESAGEVEWKNGDECTFDDRTGIFIGLSKNNRLAIVEIDNEELAHDMDLVRVCDLSKPETPQQREDRERLQAIDAMCWDVHSLKVSQASALYEAGYRKEKAHGAN